MEDFLMHWGRVRTWYENTSKQVLSGQVRWGQAITGSYGSGQVQLGKAVHRSENVDSIQNSRSGRLSTDQVWQGQVNSSNIMFFWRIFVHLSLFLDTEILKPNFIWMQRFFWVMIFPYSIQSRPKYSWDRILTMALAHLF